MMVVISDFCKGGEQRQRRTNGHRLALAASMMSGSGRGTGGSGGLGWNVEKHSRGLVEFIPRAAYVQTRETEVVSV